MKRNPRPVSPCSRISLAAQSRLRSLARLVDLNIRPGEASGAALAVLLHPPQPAASDNENQATATTKLLGAYLARA